MVLEGTQGFKLLSNDINVDKLRCKLKKDTIETLYRPIFKWINNNIHSRVSVCGNDIAHK